MKEESLELTIEQALDLGRQFLQGGNFPSAITMFRGVLVHDPEHFEAIERLGLALFETGQLYEAFYWFWLGREINRKQPDALTNYGLTLGQLGQPERGLPDLERAAAIADKGAPGEVRARIWNNLGNALERLGRHKDALEALDKGIAHNPEDAFPRYNRGIALIRLGRHREALESFERCLALHAKDERPDAPGIADARYNRGMTRLVLGDLKGGFEDYEFRLTTSENEKPNFGFPADKKWNGEELGDTPLLIVAEQGLGDTIQFLRFIPEAKRRAPNLTLAVQTALAPMVKACWPDIPLLPAKSKIPHDQLGRWAGLMSLAHLFGVEKESDLPAPWVPPLDDERVQRWATELVAYKRLRVAVCWAGNFRHKNNANRSIALETFSKLFEADCDFVSVQQVVLGDEAKIRDLCAQRQNLYAADLTDFRDTVAVMAGCDLVVTVDTSVAHMAASLGKPTWIFIPKNNTDWRWMLDRVDSPWYPSARLIRQERAGDWSSTINKTVRELSAFADGGRTACAA